MSEDHLCYMKTTEEEEATRMLKRKRKKRVDEDDEVQKWIFFDFECTQDEMIQYNEGYNLANKSYVEIATNLTVIPIHANKDTYQRR